MVDKLVAARRKKEMMKIWHTAKKQVQRNDEMMQNQMANI